MIDEMERKNQVNHENSSDSLQNFRLKSLRDGFLLELLLLRLGAIQDLQKVGRFRSHSGVNEDL